MIEKIGILVIKALIYTAVGIADMLFGKDSEEEIQQ